MSEKDREQGSVGEQQSVSMARKPAHNRDWWAKHIEKCRADGTTMVDYAKLNDLDVGNLYRWNGVLKKHTKRAPEKSRKRKPRPVRLFPKQGRKAHAMPFVEVSVPREQTQTIELVTPNGWIVRFSSKLSNEEMLKIVSVLAGCS